jgi:hypothetical protein
MSALEPVYAAALRPFAGRFDAPELLAEAERAAGLGDWGGRRWREDRFRDRLQALCDGLETAARLHSTGRSRAHSRLHVLLVSRLRQIARHAALESAPTIARPLVGTGLPRAGTTFLHGLLAADPANRVATAAQAAISAPPPGALAEEGERTGLYQRLLDFQGFAEPDLLTIHPYAAVAPEECVFLQEGACGMPLGAFYNAPDFAALATNADSLADSYAWQRAVMQVLQGDGGGGERWLLKAPSHVMHIDALFAEFPDALVFVNHRDPGKVIPSMASLYMTLYGLAGDHSVDPLALGPRLVANWAGILARFDAWRAAHPEVKIVDVHYRDLIADPIATARSVYAAFDLAFDDRAEAAMRAHLVADRHGKGPARHYALADFGLCEADIEAGFGAYIARYGVAREVRL